MSADLSVSNTVLYLAFECVAELRKGRVEYDKRQLPLWNETLKGCMPQRALTFFAKLPEEPLLRLCWLAC
eukprot:642963-Prymnesium_polylepis.1